MRDLCRRRLWAVMMICDCFRKEQMSYRMVLLWLLAAAPIYHGMGLEGVILLVELGCWRPFPVILPACWCSRMSLCCLSRQRWACHENGGLVTWLERHQLRNIY